MAGEAVVRQQGGWRHPGRLGGAFLLSLGRFSSPAQALTLTLGCLLSGHAIVSSGAGARLEFQHLPARAAARRVCSIPWQPLQEGKPRASLHKREDSLRTRRLADYIGSAELQEVIGIRPWKHRNRGEALDTCCSTGPGRKTMAC